MTNLGNCLRALGRPLPTSRVDMTACLIWNMLRQGLHRLYIGRWLANRARGALRGGEGYSREDLKASARDAALVYHKLHQLHLTGHNGGSTLMGINLALCSVNLAEAANDALTREQCAEIYATSALAVKTTFPDKMQFMAVSRKYCQYQDFRP